jgi:hypothetical protein
MADGVNASVVGESAEVVVYNHSRWSGYLLQRLLPQSHKITSRPGDTSDRILSFVGEGCSVFIFHVDLTFARGRPLDRQLLCAALRERGIRVLNSAVVDISKRRLQADCDRIGLPTTLAEPCGAPDELLIVKTDLNYGGVPELVTECPEGRPTEPCDYRVLPRRELQAGLWERPELAIERFIDSEDGRLYRCAVLGARRVWSVFASPMKVKRVPTDQTLVIGEGEVPRSARCAVDSFAMAYGRDFGAFDVLIGLDGLAYLIDFNATPVWGAGPLGALTMLAEEVVDHGSSHSSSISSRRQTTFDQGGSRSPGVP